MGAGSLTYRPGRRVMAVTRLGADRVPETREGLRRVAGDLRREYPTVHRGRGYALLDLDRWWFGTVEGPVAVMLGGSAGLLLLVLGNVAALFRVRRQEREDEMALRAALGARRGQLSGVVLTESTLLSGTAALLGLLGARFLLGRGGLLAPLDLPRFAAPSVDVVTVLVCAGLTVPLSLAFGVGGRTERVREQRRPTGWLLGLEAALAAALLTGAGALVLDAREVASTPTGFEAPGLLTARLDLSTALGDPTGAARATRERVGFARQVVAAAPGLPGVESAALVGPSVLGNAQWHIGFVPEGMDPQVYMEQWLGQRIVVTPGALRTLGVTLLRGRDLAWSDGSGSERVAVIDERIASRFWPGGNALGRRFCPDTACAAPVTVVGVAETAKHRGRAAPDEGVVGDVYLLYGAEPTSTTTLAVRTDGTSGDVAGGVRGLVGRLAPSAVLSDVRWMEERLASAEYVQRTTAALVSAYALVAAVLALVGTYGLVAVHLGRRWRDIALRMALGAGSVRLARGLVAEGVLPVLAGAALGAFGGLLWVAPLTAAVSAVGGVGGWGPAQSTLVAVSLVVAATAAAALPLLRLGLLRPMEVLRGS